MRNVSCTLTLLLAAACGDPAQPVAADGPAQAPPPLEHDFGIIPHGASRELDYLLDPTLLGRSRAGGVWIPLHVQLDCSCGRAQLFLRHRDGRERAVDGRPVAANAAAADEVVVARVVVDTSTREVADLPATISHGYVVLQAVDDRTGSQRVRWPLRLRFGVDAPVVLRPFAALDFGRVPSCRIGEVVTSLSGDENHASVQFGRVVASDPQLVPVLERSTGHVVLRLQCRPGALGNHRAVVSVETDLPGGYAVHLPVTWKVVPDLEATPMAKISFRGDLRREQAEPEATGQFVLVTDHEVSRPPEFIVRELVDGSGRDAAASFAVSFSAVPGQERQQRLHVRYLGGHPDGFRGQIVLGKAGLDAPTLPIELVAFPTRQP